MSGNRAYAPLIISVLLIWGCLSATVSSEPPFRSSDEGTPSSLSPGIRGTCNGTLLFNSTYGGDGGSTIEQVIDLAGGGYAFVGYTTSYGAGDNDLWIGKVDSLGQLLWNRTYGLAVEDYGVQIIEQDGGFLVAGHTASYGNGGFDYWLIQTDESGLHVWNQTYGTPKHEYLDTIIEVGTGGYLIVGQTGNLGYTDRNCTFLRLDTDCNHLWNVSYDRSSSDVPWDAIELEDGGFLVAGWTRPVGSDYVDGWVIKIDEEGNHLWNQTYGTPGVTDYLSSVLELEDGNLMMAGITESFGAVAGDAWILCTNSSGGALWNRTYGGADYDNGKRLIRPRSGGFVLAGNTRSFGAGGNEAMLLRLDNECDVIWNRTYGGGMNDYLYFMAEVDSGGFLMWGFSYSYGPGGWGGWLLLVPELLWLDPPLYVELPQNLIEYVLPATSSADITWTLNDTAHFYVSSDGVLANVTSVALGEYGVNVTATDAVGNSDWVTFDVIVQEPVTTTATTTVASTTTATTTPPGSEFMLLLTIAAVVGGVVVVALVVAYMRMRPET